MDQETKVRAILFNIMIAVTSASLGFGASQMLLATEVHVNSNRITHLERADTDIISRIEAEAKRNDSRIQDLTAGMREQIKQGTELIALIRVQNQLMNKP